MDQPSLIADPQICDLQQTLRKATEGLKAGTHFSQQHTEAASALLGTIAAKRLLPQNLGNELLLDLANAVAVNPSITDIKTREWYFQKDIEGIGAEYLKKNKIPSSERTEADRQRNTLLCFLNYAADLAKRRAAKRSPEPKKVTRYSGVISLLGGFSSFLSINILANSDIGKRLLAEHTARLRAEDEFTRRVRHF